MEQQEGKEMELKETEEPLQDSSMIRMKNAIRPENPDYFTDEQERNSAKTDTIKPPSSTPFDPTPLLMNFGTPVEDECFLNELRHRLWAGLLERPGRTLQFPGSQPVSFASKHLSLLEQEDYYVCEKSDGVRYLLYYTSPYDRPTSFLIDRCFGCRELVGVTLASRVEGEIHVDTLLDGELVCVHDDVTGKSRFIFYIFDLLLINGHNVMSEPLPMRLKFVQNDVIAPFQGMRARGEAEDYPFQMEIKKMWKPYAIAEILELVIPRQSHGNDGLIFTPVMDPYMVGTCTRLLKWKPPEMNTVDFKLVLTPNCPPNDPRRYQIHVATRDNHRPYAHLHPDPVLETLNGKIVECRYSSGDADGGEWRFVRERPDKAMANYETVVEKILSSIQDNVTADQLIKRIPAIRRAWRLREQRSTVVAESKEPIKRPRM